MMRKVWPIVLVATAALLVALVLILATAKRVRPIGELRSVYYSFPEQYADFVVNRAPKEIGWVHLPRPSSGSAYRSGFDPSRAGFVRPEVCGECHREHFEGHKLTAHFRTSQEARPDTVLGSFAPEHSRIATRDPTLFFEMLSDRGGLYQRLVVERGGTTYEHTCRFDIVTGSGNHGQTYLYWQGDELYQLPISYFSESGGWINSPGLFRDGTADFARCITERCLDCHATFFASAPAHVARFDRENYILGVTCVRCHGHGWAHVQFHRTNPSEQAPRYIVHPGQLPRDRANDVCAQCHSGAGKLLAPAFSYQPGEPLDQYLRTSFASSEQNNDDPHAADQLERLKKSRCFQESEKLTCASCHDPHRHERGDLELFSARCGKCHESGDCKLAGKTMVPIEQHCVECHMPSRRDIQGVMETSEGKEVLPLLRDHYIRIWPDAAAQVMEKWKAR